MSRPGGVWGCSAAMDCEQPDSLEGWVPLREDLFREPERHQLRFLVAWNAAEGQFAVTCHDRTAQRRRGRPEGGGGGCSWAGLLSAAGFRGAHRQLVALWPALERCFPPMPPELEAAGGAGWGLGRGLWALVWPAPADPGDAALQELCRQLERYLSQAADGCGGATVRDALFPAPGDPADCEGLREFRERTLRTRLDGAAARLRQVLQDHGKADTMVALMKVYQEEDEAYQELVTMATMFFQYLLQPFRDMREVATSCKLDILKSLNEDDLGPRRVVSLQKEANEWTRRAEEAVVSIQDITVNYFKETVTALTGMQKQMEQDQKRFGQAAWSTAIPRLESLQLRLARETLQLMRARELCLNHKCADIHRKVEDLPDQRKNIDAVDELEIQYYETQLELYEVKLEILRSEETILVTQLDSVKRLIKEKQEEVVYYDPCENPEELKGLAPGLELHLENEELRVLTQRCRQLEAQRGRICTRRAHLRNRKDHCRENHQLRLQQAKQSVRHLHRHHSIQMKRDKIKEEEEKKKEWINHERQKTLERLRAYREKCPAPRSALKMTCSETQVPNVSGGRCQKRASTAHHKIAHPASSKTRSVTLSPAANKKTPEHQDSCGSVPVQDFVPVGDQILSRLSEDHSLPPQPPPPPPLPLPPPPPPLPALSSSQATTHQNLGLRTLATEDRPLSLVCEVSPERPFDYLEGFQHPGSMDEVLASLRQGRASLRKVEAPTLSPPRTSVNEQVLAAIRQGVQLKKVHPDASVEPGRKRTSDLERSIRAALERIKRVSADSEDSDEQSPGDWDR